MLVKMTQTIQGRVAGHWNPAKGAEIEVEDRAGALLCAKKFATPVAVTEPVEIRTPEPAPAPEPAPEPAPAPRRKRTTRKAPKA